MKLSVLFLLTVCCILFCGCGEQPVHERSPFTIPAYMTIIPETTTALPVTAAPATTTTAATETTTVSVTTTTATFMNAVPEYVTADIKPTETAAAPDIRTEKRKNGNTYITCALTYHSPVTLEPITIEMTGLDSSYRSLCEKPRANDSSKTASKYEYYLREPNSRKLMQDIAQCFMEDAIFEDYSAMDRVREAIAYVQAFPYISDGEVNYWRYPMETVFNGGGDCEDSSLLMAGILHEMGYGTCFLKLDRGDSGHVAIGIQTVDTEHATFQAFGNSYYYIETTGFGWEMGVVPEDVSGKMTAIQPTW